jgi:hypothetical protein
VIVAAGACRERVRRVSRATSCESWCGWLAQCAGHPMRHVVLGSRRDPWE